MNRIAFMGTPETAVPALRVIAGRYEVPVVLTQPDRPKGRSNRLEPSPVKLAATELAIPVAQPTSAASVLETLVAAGPLDAAVVVAYGRIIRPDALALPRSGMVNVHFSLLPRWRGAAPVNRAVMAGDPMTGVTLMKMDEGLDTGPILMAQAVDIGRSETAGELASRLATLGADLLARYADAYLTGDLAPVTQSEEGLTYAAKITPSDRAISLQASPEEVFNHVRGLAPVPAATLRIDDEPHKILGVEPVETAVPPGEWALDGGWPVAGLESGAIRLTHLQSPGRSALAGDAWARGRSASHGRVS